MMVISVQVTLLRHLCLQLNHSRLTYINLKFRIRSNLPLLSTSCQVTPSKNITKNKLDAFNRKHKLMTYSMLNPMVKPSAHRIKFLIKTVLQHEKGTLLQLIVWH